MIGRRDVLILASLLVAGGCAGRGDGPVPPSAAEAPPPFAAAPDFTLPDHTGTPRTLSELHGPRGLILVTYRGHW